MGEILVRNFCEIFFYAGISFLIAIFVFPKFIRFVQKFKLTQKIRDRQISGGIAQIFRALHAHKAGTPVMGGAVIIFAVLTTVALSRIFSFFGIIDHSILNRGETYLPIITLAAVGFLGAIDDFLNIDENLVKKFFSKKTKIYFFLFLIFSAAARFLALNFLENFFSPANFFAAKNFLNFFFALAIFLNLIGLILFFEKKNQKGLSARVKFLTLFFFAIAGAAWFSFKLGWSKIHIPAVGDADIGLFYFPVFIFIFVGTANSVNLTDGLDGLAGGLLAIAFSVFSVISYFYGLPILSVFCATIVGALGAFLWFNVPPAKIYMGDTGSLALGATLGVIAMLTNAVLILAVVGFIFIFETISVILQLFWKKFFKKKLFAIAPIHHHFETRGWSETQIVMRFWILGAGVGIIGLIVGILGMGNGRGF